ncbi:MAG TPA: protein kinase [Vicinamibacteria bacterium]|nr:protein kinase [Vicinamibacteria bacterium]
MIGETTSHYRVLQRLGAGGMGEVYLAEDLRLHRQVALKVLRGGGDEAARRRLLREARLASALNHPNIAVIYEIDETSGEGGWTSFIAMEYVPGQTLGEFARTHPLEVPQAVALVRQAAEALTEAHDRGIVHRDVKSSNIMVTETGRVKVLDFGLAQHSPGAAFDAEGSTWSRESRDGAARGLAGTVAYMSPEQARGRDLDPRSDVFSLGVVFYELLTGSLPFTGRNAVEVIDAILNRDPPPAVPRGSGGGPELTRILRRMLAKDRDQRYPSLRELVRDLDSLAREGPPLPAAAPPAPVVAVMSLMNITRSGEDDWLGTGIAETVTADLKCVEGLTVVGRERVWEALRKLGAASAPDEAEAIRAGRELGARWVVTGGYQRLGETVRVTARVTDVDTGAVVHTVKIDGTMGQIFALQDRIVDELSSGLRLRLSPGTRGGEETHLLEAYEAFAKGMLNLRLESYEALDRAVLFFERAVALDPGYARAHLQLGSTYDVKAAYLVLPEMHERAIGSFRRAIELAPDLALAWKELGSALTSLGREEEGIEAVQRALALDPADAAAHNALARAFFIGRADFERAAVEYETALRLNPQAGWSALQLAHCAALLRDFARGEAVARQAAALQEQMQSGRDGVVIVGSHMRLGHLAALQGRHQEALEHLERERRFLQQVDHALRNRTTIELHQRIGSAHLHLGQQAEAQAAFGLALALFEERLRLGADDPFTRFYVAGIHALRGERELALSSLARAARMRRRFTVARARIEPEFESLREESGFRELVGEA